MDNLRRLEVWYHSRLVGCLAMTDDGLCTFEYSGAFLSDGFSISPFELPLQKGVFVAKRNPFEGGFGVFDDALPDGWGLLVLDRYLQSIGQKPSELNLLDRLALVGKSGRGALEFVPDKSVSPAYDLLPSDGFGGYHTTSINDSISPNDTDLFALATKAGLPQKKAEDVLERMRMIIGTSKFED